MNDFDFNRIITIKSTKINHKTANNSNNQVNSRKKT